MLCSAHWLPAPDGLSLYSVARVVWLAWPMAHGLVVLHLSGHQHSGHAVICRGICGAILPSVWELVEPTLAEATWHRGMILAWAPPDLAGQRANNSGRPAICAFRR
jgi:hypothetical protein